MSSPRVATTLPAVHVLLRSLSTCVVANSQMHALQQQTSSPQRSSLQCLHVRRQASLVSAILESSDVCLRAVEILQDSKSPAVLNSRTVKDLLHHGLKAVSARAPPHQHHRCLHATQRASLSSARRHVRLPAVDLLRGSKSQAVLTSRTVPLPQHGLQPVSACALPTAHHRRHHHLQVRAKLGSKDMWRNSSRISSEAPVYAVQALAAPVAELSAQAALEARANAAWVMVPGMVSLPVVSAAQAMVPLALSWDNDASTELQELP